jgi:hypothetical protein
VLGFAGLEAQAAVFDVEGPLARMVGATVPFSLFIGELPSEAACGEIQIEADEHKRTATETVSRRSKIGREATAETSSAAFDGS